MQRAFTLRNNHGCCRVTNDIRDNTGHVQNPVDASQKTDGLQRRFTAFSTMVIITRPEPGIPAVPTEASTTVTITMI